MYNIYEIRLWLSVGANLSVVDAVWLDVNRSVFVNGVDDEISEFVDGVLHV